MSPRPVGVCGRTKSLSREVAWFVRRVGGNPGAASTRARSHACRGAWIQTVVLSGTAAWIRSSGVSPGSSRSARIKTISACVARTSAAPPSGRAAGLQGLESSSSAAILRATISRSQHQRADRDLSWEVRYVSATPPSGVCGIRRAHSLREAWQTLQTLRMTPTCKPGPFGEPGRPLCPTPATDLPSVERPGIEMLCYQRQRLRQASLGRCDNTVRRQATDACRKAGSQPQGWPGGCPATATSNADSRMAPSGVS